MSENCNYSNKKVRNSGDFAGCKKGVCTFAVGAVGYCALETLWRGRTHPSMAVCGGAALTAFHDLAARSGSRLRLCLRGCALITGLELLCGLCCNRDRRIWDYSRSPGNFRGQICPAYSALWFLLCLALSYACPLLERHLARLEGKPGEPVDKPAKRRL